MKTKHLVALLTLFSSLLWLSCTSHEVEYTRGIGVYPGDCDAYTGPLLVSGDNTYRNVALHRKTFSSSSYDYNLTAQLATDGIVTADMPAYLNISTKDGVLKRNEREWMFDGKVDSKYTGVKGTQNFLMLELANGSQPVTRTSLRGVLFADTQLGTRYLFTLEASQDGESWTILKREQGKVTAARFQFNLTATWDTPVNYSFYRLTFDVPSAKEWWFTDWDFFNENQQVLITTQQYFKSNWMSLGNETEWLMVDLGAEAEFDKLKLTWVNKAMEGCVLASDDGENWRELTHLPGGDTRIDEIQVKGKARYVKVQMEQSENGKPYVLSELELFGKGGLVPQAQPAPQATGNELYLSGGNWKLNRASLVNDNGETLSAVGYPAEDWVIATVPGTVLTSYVNIGAIPDGNYADEQNYISDAFFISDFWYRDEFTVPASFKGQKLFLHFDGINWKANIFVNGVKVGRMEGAFMAAEYDVTALIKAGEVNALAVQIIKNDTYGAVKEKNRMSTDQNGGILGADNPTFHASIGWDWIPTVRGRNIGIWNDVYLTAHEGGVTIEEPFVTTDLPLPCIDTAYINAEMLLVNHNDSAVTGTLTFAYGKVKSSQEVTLDAHSSQKVVIDSLLMKKPKLWMPKGYGEPNLYDVTISFAIDDVVSHERSFKSGVREMSYAVNDGALDIYVNGRRLIGNGGNWGFPEVNLNYRAREYDIAVAYHADMNFTLIRNWVGMTGDEEFYEACDRHGVMIWQDFWLANPWDGPVPNDNDMFMKNAENYLKRIRNHPSLALYCGRNEGNPPAVLDSALAKLVSEEHAGLHYIPHSSQGVVSGEGPYCYQTPYAYFANPKGYNKFHSERGMPNVMTYESVAQMLPEKDWWSPTTNLWGMHDFTLGSAQKAQVFVDAVEKAFGKASSMEEFTEWAQWINYEGYRAMFEARSRHRKGLLLWMSHSCWPSMTWDTYDYYFEPTAAYFGCKKASAPIHIQWNPLTRKVEVVNNSVTDEGTLKAQAQWVNIDGTVVCEKEKTLSASCDYTASLPELELEDSSALSEVYFIKLRLFGDDELLADNFYWFGNEEGNYKALKEMEKTQVTIRKESSRKNGNIETVATLLNTGTVPALMLRLKVSGKESGERILPVLYEDNYFALMPGETKTIKIIYKTEDTRGETPQIELSGFNLK